MSSSPDSNQGSNLPQAHTGVGLEHWDGEFPSTHWSLVLDKTERDEMTAEALTALSARYWYPLYAYLRRRGYGSADAQDLTQGFFASLLTTDGLRNSDPHKGTFRSYLLGALKHHVANARAHASAQKRGGGRVPISIDQVVAEERFQLEPADESAPDKAYEKSWALAVLENVLASVEQEYVESGKVETFQTLKGVLTGDTERGDYRTIARQLETTETNVRTKVKRLRQRFRDRMQDHVSQLVGSPDQVKEEIQFLLRALSHQGHS